MFNNKADGFPNRGMHLSGTHFLRTVTIPNDVMDNLHIPKGVCHYRTWSTCRGMAGVDIMGSLNVYV